MSANNFDEDQEVIRFPKQLFRALVVESSGDGKWSAVCRTGPQWVDGWRSEPADIQATIQKAREIARPRGLPLLIREPGQPYKTLPRHASDPLPQRVHRGRRYE